MATPDLALVSAVVVGGTTIGPTAFAMLGTGHRDPWPMTPASEQRRVSDFGADAFTKAAVVFQLYLASIFPSHAMTRMLALRTF